jgi:hypothetical protein
MAEKPVISLYRLEISSRPAAAKKLPIMFTSLSKYMQTKFSNHPIKIEYACLCEICCWSSCYKGHMSLPLC